MTAGARFSAGELKQPALNAVARSIGKGEPQGSPMDGRCGWGGSHNHRDRWSNGQADVEIGKGERCGERLDRLILIFSLSLSFKPISRNIVKRGHL